MDFLGRGNYIHSSAEFPKQLRYCCCTDKMSSQDMFWSNLYGVSIVSIAKHMKSRHEKVIQLHRTVCAGRKESTLAAMAGMDNSVRQS